MSGGFTRLTNIKEIDVSENPEIRVEGWTTLMGAISQTVERLKFRDCHLNSEKVKTITRGVERFTNIKDIDFGGNSDLGAEGWAALMHAISSGVEILSFEHCGLDIEESIVIAGVFVRLTNIKNINFRGNTDIGVEGWTVLMGAIPPTVESLKFGHCKLNTEKVEAITGGFTRLTNMKEINVRDNPEIGVEDYSTILGRLPPTAKLMNTSWKLNDGSDAEKFATKVKDLNFTGLLVRLGSLSSISADKLLSMTRQTTNCRFESEECGVGEWTSPASCELENVSALEMKVADNVDTLTPSFEWVSIASSCRRFGLNVEGLSAEMAHSFLTSMSTTAESMKLSGSSTDFAITAKDRLPGFTSLKELDLSESPLLTVQGWATLMPAISPTVEILNFSCCELDTEKSKVIAMGFIRLTNIKSINFQRNNVIGVEGWAALMPAVSPTVEILNFFNCELDTEKSKAIASGFVRLTSVKSINFRGNRKNAVEGWAALMPAISPTVEIFDFSGCCLDTEKSKVIAMGFIRLTNIKNINFQENRDIGVEGWAALMPAVSPTVETLNFVNCGLSTEKSKVIAGEFARLTNIEDIDFQYNPNIDAEGWTAIATGLAGLPNIKKIVAVENTMSLVGDALRLLEQVAAQRNAVLRTG